MASFEYNVFSWWSVVVGTEYNDYTSLDLSRNLQIGDVHSIAAKKGQLITGVQSVTATACLLFSLSERDTTCSTVVIWVKFVKN